MTKQIKKVQKELEIFKNQITSDLIKNKISFANFVVNSKFAKEILKLSFDELEEADEEIDEAWNLVGHAEAILYAESALINNCINLRIPKKPASEKQ